jgi:hypothetical protein
MKKTLLSLCFCLTAGLVRAEHTSLNLGFDYRWRGVSIQNADMADATKDTFGYSSQRARFYLTAWLNENVEAAFRLQSIGVSGMEGSGSPVTRYPKADGTPWVEDAYIHMPNMAWKRLDLTIGRQPIVIGDGMLVSSDDLGYNAIRGRVTGPLNTEFDLFSAKIAESLNGNNDFDLRGVVFRTRKEERHWDLAWIQEVNASNSEYRLAASTVTASKVTRQFYDVRLFGDLIGAYYKIEVAMQKGEAMLLSGESIGLKGLGQRLELGAQKDTEKWGRFGVRAVYATGSGDDAGTGGTDEAFRPTFARRWDGLERSGYGTHYAATLSDAFDPSAPFASGTTGLPAGFSGIKTMGMGIHSTQKVFWTGSMDYFVYQSRTKPTGLNDLGAELDAELAYRYTGFVTFRLGAALFFPGQVYGANASRVTRTFAEAHVHF